MHGPIIMYNSRSPSIYHAVCISRSICIIHNYVYYASGIRYSMFKCIHIMRTTKAKLDKPDSSSQFKTKQHHMMTACIILSLQGRRKRFEGG